MTNDAKKPHHVPAKDLSLEADEELGAEDLDAVSGGAMEQGYKPPAQAPSDIESAGRRALEAKAKGGRAMESDSKER